MSVSRRGFSLFELLLLLALLLIGLGLLLPAVQKVRNAAARAGDGNNLHQITLAIANCADTNQGKLPPLAGTYPLLNDPDLKTAGNGYGTVFFHILPYIEQDALYKFSADDTGTYNVGRNGVQSHVVKTYISNLDPRGNKYPDYDGWLALSNYAANFQAFGDPASNSLQGKATYPASFTDGTSQTILFAQRYQTCNGDPNAWGYDGGTAWTPAFAYLSKDKFQTRPPMDRCNSSLAQGLNEGGIMVGMADASTRFVARTVSAETWWAACTPAGNDLLGPDW